MNSDMVKGKWTEIKGEVQKAWGKLTSDELETTKGDLTAISGLIQQKYGQSKEKYSDQLNQIFSKFSDKKDQIADATKEQLRK